MVEKLLSGDADQPLLHDMISGPFTLVWVYPTRKRPGMSIGLF